MFFKKDITLQTSLTVEELFDKIEAISQKSYKYRYKARIDKSKKAFYLFQLFDYGNHNMIRPEIIGQIEDNVEIRIVRIKFRLSGDLKALFIGALIFNAIIYVAIILGLLPKEADFMIIGLPVCIAIFFIMSLSFFNRKASFSMELLTRVFKGIKLS